MAQLSTKVKLYCADNGVENVDFMKEVMLQDDGSGAYIKIWGLEISKPTEEQLASYEADGNIAEANAEVVSTRKSLYGTPEKQLENIIENGLQAEVDRVTQIKTDNPKQ